MDVSAPSSIGVAGLASAASEAMYTVQSGDWLSKIAPRFGITWQALYEANQDVIGPDPDLIHPGQVLRIPTGASADVAPPPQEIQEPPAFVDSQAAEGAAQISAFPTGIGAELVRIAQREIGVKEDSPNESERIREYRTATAGAAGPAPWCGYFVSWVAKQAGVPIGQGGSGLGSVLAIQDWARQTGRFHNDTPKPGDLIIFEWGDGDGKPDHVGIVEFVDADGSVHTIEGNTSDAVARNVFRPGGPIVGYVSMG